MNFDKINDHEAFSSINSHYSNMQYVYEVKVRQNKIQPKMCSGEISLNLVHTVLSQ